MKNTITFLVGALVLVPVMASALTIRITNTSTITSTTTAKASTGGNTVGIGGVIITGATSTTVRTYNRR